MIDKHSPDNATTGGQLFAGFVVAGDPAQWPLPANVRAKLLAIIDRREDAHASLSALSEKLQEAQQDWQRAEIEFNGRKAGIWPRPKEDELPPWWIERRAKVEKLRAESLRLKERYDELAEMWQPFAALAHRLEAYLKQVGANVREAPQVAAQPRKNETLPTAIERCRRRGRELLADRRATQVAPHPSALQKEKAAAQIAAAAERIAPNVHCMIDHDEPFRFPSIALSGSAETGYYIDGKCVESILAWIDPEKFLATIIAKIDGHADDANALTDSQRTQKIAEIDRDLLATAREEVSFCEAAGIALRADLDPRAVLGLADDLPKPVE